MYSRSYIGREKFFSRFLILVGLFVCRIALLIFSPNFVRILLGWDGLGVTSYLLVIYYQSEKSFNAGIVTALTNRLGDACLLCLIGIITQWGTWSFFYFRVSPNKILERAIILLCVLAAITKRAQIPFSSWLPAAMAAPTPVSSLVHSSTLVTAGVYLLIRINYLLRSWENLKWLVLLGCLTILIAGVSAMGEVDIKKIIALSTLSQLGLMFFVLGLGLPLFSFFHLIAHAYFKAMLFMCAGGVIHSIKEYQDLRTIGGGLLQLPVSVSVFFVANLRLCGIPFIRGFYSKDLILELIMINGRRLLVVFLSIFATGVTVAYSCRITKLIFFSLPIFERGGNIAERDNTILLGMLILLLPSIIGGLGFSWLVLASGNLIFLPAWLKIIILVLVLITGIKFLIRDITFKKNIIFSFLHYMWFLPWLFRSSLSYMGIKSRKRIFLRREMRWRFTPATSGKILRLNVANYSRQGVSMYFLKSILIIFVVGIFL